MVKRFVLAIALMALVTGCGGSGSSKPATYHDKRFGFTFKYPSDWKAPAQGTVQDVGGVSTYIVDLRPKDNSVDFQVTVDRNVIPIPAFPEGKIAHDPNGGPDIYHYHHLNVSGWPAMGIQRFNGSQVDGLFTIINTHSLSYQVRMIVANPPVNQSQTNDYNMVVHSLKIPFS